MAALRFNCNGITEDGICKASDQAQEEPNTPAAGYA